MLIFRAVQGEAGGDACLWTWQISSCLRQRQLKSSLEEVLVAFGSDELHRVYGKGNWNPAPKVYWLPWDLAGFNEMMAVTLQQYVLANLMLFSCLYYIYNGYINHIAEICFMN
jgi:hypothetical protein